MRILVDFASLFPRKNLTYCICLTGKFWTTKFQNEPKNNHYLCPPSEARRLCFAENVKSHDVLKLFRAWTLLTFDLCKVYIVNPDNGCLPKGQKKTVDKKIWLFYLSKVQNIKLKLFMCNQGSSVRKKNWLKIKYNTKLTSKK